MKPGTRFPPGATRPAGHIFFIPPAERITDDTKSRPHFLVNRCDVAAEPLGLATLAHMSTKATEHVLYGSPIHELGGVSVREKPDHDGHFVIATRVLPRDPNRLQRSAMSAGDEAPAVRRAVLQALGLGDGLPAQTTDSVRGRLARIVDPRTGYPFGIVLTAHVYSARRRYQLIAPLLDGLVEGPGGPEVLEPLPWDLAPAPHPWWQELGLSQPIVDCAAVISLSEEWRQSGDRRTWLKRQITIMDSAIDEATLLAIEERVAERLRR